MESDEAGEKGRLQECQGHIDQEAAADGTLHKRQEGWLVEASILAAAQAGVSSSAHVASRQCVKRQGGHLQAE